MSAPALEAAFEVRVGERGAGFTLQAELALEHGVLVLFGPSGTGKSVALQVLAGLLRPQRGSLRVGGDLLFDGARRLHVPTHRRRIGYVPQHHALFPFLDVAQNVAFGLPRRERRRAAPEVQGLLAEMGLTHLAGARPSSLSGGERQRVALARALAVKPRLLLLDEPFAALDGRSRVELRETLRRALTLHGTPAVFVTHDPEEALALGQRLVRFERGRTVQSGAPAALLQTHGPWITVTGSAQGPVEASGEGRSRLRLGATLLEGPADVLGATGPEVRLTLRAEPRPTQPQPPAADRP